MAMIRIPSLWTAFYAGLAAPVGLYAAPPPYVMYLGGYSVPAVFGMVGLNLRRVTSQVQDAPTQPASEAE